MDTSRALSTKAQVGAILLLVASILAVLNALTNLALAWGLSFVPTPGIPFGFGGSLLPGFWFVLGALALGGAVVGFLGWRRTQQGAVRSAATLAFVATFLPPIGWLFLVAAIFLYVSDEAQVTRSA